MEKREKISMECKSKEDGFECNVKKNDELVGTRALIRDDGTMNFDVDGDFMRNFLRGRMGYPE